MKDEIERVLSKYDVTITDELLIELEKYIDEYSNKSLVILLRSYLRDHTGIAASYAEKVIKAIKNA